MVLFAELDKNNVVKQVIVISEEDCQDMNGNYSEDIGIAFCKKLIGADTGWVRTYKDGEYRTRYAGPGYTYNESLDVFIPPKPYKSWVLNGQTLDWDSPVPMPSDAPEGSFYIWDEETLSWVLKNLFPTGYNPNATDGDGDGFVQDATPFERPIGT